MSPGSTSQAHFMSARPATPASDWGLHDREYLASALITGRVQLMGCLQLWRRCRPKGRAVPGHAFAVGSAAVMVAAVGRSAVADLAGGVYGFPVALTSSERRHAQRSRCPSAFPRGDPECCGEQQEVATASHGGNDDGDASGHFVGRLPGRPGHTDARRALARASAAIEPATARLGCPDMQLHRAGRAQATPGRRNSQA